ncbi:MAG: PIN domain-containing protein [Caldimonas sp.]
MIGVDTNVLVRYFAQDDPKQFARVRRFLEERLREDAPGHVSLVVLVELVWVLVSRYGASRDEVVVVVEELLADSRLRVQDAMAVWAAVDEFEATSADFADALIVAVDREHGCERTVTLDRRAARIEGMELLA